LHPDGVLRVEDAETGMLFLQVEPDVGTGFAASRVVEVAHSEPGASVDVDVQPALRVRCRVMTVHGAPIEGARVEAIWPSSRQTFSPSSRALDWRRTLPRWPDPPLPLVVATGRCDASGGLELELPAQVPELVLRATADGHDPAVLPVVPGQDTPITIRLDSEARIRIECTDDSSRASLLARAASVRLRNRDGALVSVSGVTEWPVPDAGPLIVRHLEPGGYDLRVRVEPVPGTEREQQRTELARSFATVRLAAGGERVVVLPADPLPCAWIGFQSFGVGRELPGMHVAVRLHRARSADGAFDPAGWVEVPLAKLMAAPYPVDAGVAYRLELRWSVEGFESGAWLSGWTQAASGVSISPTETRAWSGSRSWTARRTPPAGRRLRPSGTWCARGERSAPCGSDRRVGVRSCSRPRATRPPGRCTAVASEPR
jgi:hypothetical protein